MASTSSKAYTGKQVRALERLEYVQVVRTQAEGDLSNVRNEQDDAVESALQAGLDITTIARALGVSRFTIYHRRKNR